MCQDREFRPETGNSGNPDAYMGNVAESGIPAGNGKFRLETANSGNSDVSREMWQDREFRPETGNSGWKRRIPGILMFTREMANSRKNGVSAGNGVSGGPPRL